jgi:hypothetical protein
LLPLLKNNEGCPNELVNDISQLATVLLDPPENISELRKQAHNAAVLLDHYREWWVLARAWKSSPIQQIKDLALGNSDQLEHGSSNSAPILSGDAAQHFKSNLEDFTQAAGKFELASVPPCIVEMAANLKDSIRAWLELCQIDKSLNAFHLRVLLVELAEKLAPAEARGNSPCTVVLDVNDLLHKPNRTRRGQKIRPYPLFLYACQAGILESELIGSCTDKNLSGSSL